MNNFCQILILILFSLSSFGQERCGTNLVWNFHSKTNSELIINKQRIETKINEYNTKRKSVSQQYEIPVVFHVLYNQNTEQISENQILSQLQVLNEDFRRNNNDANNTPSEFTNVAADTEINFCLAKRTPNNDLSSGITYTYTNISSFSIYDNRIFHDSLGGKTIWDPSKYLNIYVCNLTNALGFSSFPGGVEQRDGVVIHYENFGTTGNLNSNYNKGRTATHEVGHWLNLLHIWGDSNCGSDLVDDTPEQEVENYGCPTHPSPTCSNSGDMFQNFMDYSNDACMNLFTEGQKNRMHATLETERTNLSNQITCIEPYEDIGINDNISPLINEAICGYDIEIKTSVFNYSNNVINSFNVNYQLDNQAIQTVEWNGTLAPNTSIEIFLDNQTTTQGQHQLIIYTDLPNNFRDLNTSNDTITLGFEVIDGVELDLKIVADNYGDETSWQITDEVGQIVFQENGISNNQIYNKQMCLDRDICYTFSIFDSNNDGICCDFGNGYFELNNQLFSGNFDDQTNVDICQLLSIDNSNQKSLTIFPNPFSDYLYFESNNKISKIKIIDITGKLIYQSFVKNENINLSFLKQGIYIAQIKTTSEIITKKIIKK